MTATHTVTVQDIGPVAVTAGERGDRDAPAFLLLHGGAGPQSVAGFADLLAATGHVVTPTHPGFGGTPRPDELDSVRGLAALYVALLDELDLTEVTVVGNSVGGWITAEMALLGSDRIARVVLVDAVGIEVPGEPVADFFSLTMDQVAELSYHDPDSFRIDPAALPPAQQAAMAGNRAALAVYGGTAMADATLRERLSAVALPALVLWGEADRIVTPAYGRAFAAAIPGARFEVLPRTGHVPQVETPGQLLDAILRPPRLEVSIVGPTDGEVAVLGPIRMRILEDGSTTAHRLGLGEITIPPHTDGPAQHRHAQHDEGFYVVSGTARFTVGETSYDAGPRTLVMVPTGAPHTFANPGDEPAVLLNTFTPDLYVQYFRDLSDMFATGAATPAALGEVMSHYATEPSTEYADT